MSEKNMKCYEMFFQIEQTKLRNLCVREGWFKYSTTEEFNVFLDKACRRISSVSELLALAMDIRPHVLTSDQADLRHILTSLANETAWLHFKEVPMPKKPERFRDKLRKRLRFWERRS